MVYNERSRAGAGNTLPGHFTTPCEGAMQNDSTPVEYRDIAGFPGYRVGDDGSVWSCRVIGSKNKHSEWRRLPGRAKNGYCEYRIRQAGVRITHLGHRLVLQAFVGPCPPRMQACHNNGVRSDNRLVNLRWDTALNNIGDREKHGTTPRGSRNGSAKLTEEDVREIRSTYASGGCTYRSLADRFGISYTQVGSIIRGEWWAHLQS